MYRCPKCGTPHSRNDWVRSYIKDGVQWWTCQYCGHVAREKDWRKVNGSR